MNTMTLMEALKRITPVRGTTSLISAIMSGDLEPVVGRDANFRKRWGSGRLDTARERLTHYEYAQAHAQSDWAYWGYQGDISYWKAVCSLLEAAEITGDDNLPDVAGPDIEGHVVMDACAHQERWGLAVLAAAREVSREK